MLRKVAAWSAVIGGLGVLDLALNERHDGSTFSECTRWTKNQIPYGDEVFTGVWAGFAVWFWCHIIYGGKKCPPSPHPL